LFFGLLQGAYLIVPVKMQEANSLRDVVDCSQRERSEPQVAL
jgi:hypothetical protein